MGKRQVQGINVSTPLVPPSFDFKVTSFQKAEVTGKIHRKSSSSLPIWLRKKHFWGVKKIDLFFHSECTRYGIIIS